VPSTPYKPAPIKGMRRAPGPPMMSSTAAMKIGDFVLYQGRPYVLRGLDPMGVPERRVILEDPETGEEITAFAGEVSPAEPRPPNAV
jgi:hypothetical protein